MLIKGTVTGTATDNKGNFQLRLLKQCVDFFLFLVRGKENKFFVESEKPIQVVVGNDIEG